VVCFTPNAEGFSFRMPSPWLVNVLRLSIFSSAPVVPSEKFWELATGQPESENRATVPGGKTYSGKMFSGLVTVSVAGNRVDLVFVPDPDRVSELPAIGPLDDLAGAFTRSAKALMDGLAVPVVRLALGGTMFQPYESIEACYGALQQLSKSLSIDPKRARDIIYRVNWPVESKVVGGLKLNRLTTLSVTRFARMLVQVGDQAQPTVSSAPEASNQFLSLEFDHNTDHEHQSALEKAAISPIFDELFELAKQNLEVGEVI
jgi:hypothetical protein